MWVVQISGAVVHPGVYELAPGSRVRDAVQAAGGLSPGASAVLNLASLLEDGQFIFIPAGVLDTPPAQRGDSLSVTIEAAPAQGASAQAATAGLININTAALEELDQLPDIGPVIAQRIIDYRTTSGPFETIEDIMNVPGIGQVIFDKIEDLIAVEP
jgi:competence protein ComEA